MIWFGNKVLFWKMYWVLCFKIISINWIDTDVYAGINIVICICDIRDLYLRVILVFIMLISIFISQLLSLVNMLWFLYSCYQVKVKTRAEKTDLAAGSDEAWNTIQQKALEKALKQFPKGTDQRWDRIAKAVPEKTKVMVAIS